MTDQKSHFSDKVDILLVDDQQGKLMTYELILQELGHNLLKASSAKEAFELLLKSNRVAVILIDVCMPDLNGFELAQIIRGHPRFNETAIIFVSAINVSELDAIKGYELGGVDYVSVPVVPDVLRAKVRVFIELYLKTRALARMNDELEQRVSERTAQLEAAVARQELLAREVDHRARNALAVIQSIVALTPPDDSRYFADVITGRIRAMATAQNLLSESRWRGADLLRLVKEELSPYSHDGHIAITGDAVSIAPAIAQSLALALHELATNAAKYGALKHRDGRLSVAWRICVDHLELDWAEDGGSDISPPSRSGFGSKVIETSIRHQLRGSIDRNWRPQGLVCLIKLPREHFTSPEMVAAAADEQLSESKTEVIRGRRILVLEDEPLIAMMTSRVVEELDANVVGPFAMVGEAREALSGQLDAALLDVNLGGYPVYGLADEIRSHGIPIVFVTGYHSCAIEPRFSDAPVLTKPIERRDLSMALTRVLAPRPLSEPMHKKKN